MIFKKKAVTEVHIKRGKDRVVRSSVTGYTHDVVNMLCCALAAYMVKNRKEDTSRGAVRDELLDAVGAHFDDQWKMQVLEGRKR